MPSNIDKTVLYNIIKRNISNLCSKSPIFWTFKDTISNYVINYIDPYVNAFLDNGKLDIDMTANFAAEEINSRIQKFKEEYKKEYENKVDI